MTAIIVETRVDEKVKDEVDAVLGSMGLTLSDAFHLMLIRIAADKALPFQPLVPNTETIEAIEAARRGELASFASIDALLADLNAGD